MQKDENLTITTNKYWNNNHNCAQTAACGLLDYYGLDSMIEPIKIFSTRYGAGAGEYSICGAVLGTLGAISLILNEKSSNEQIKEATNIFKQRLKQKISSLQCHELMDEFMNDQGKIEFSMPGRWECCTDAIMNAVHIANDIIKQYES